MDGVIFINLTAASTVAERISYEDALQLYTDFLIMKDPTVPYPSGEAESFLVDPDSIGEVLDLDDDGLLLIVKI